MKQRHKRKPASKHYRAPEQSGLYSVRLRIKEILDDNEVSAYKLAKEMDVWPSALTPLLKNDSNVTLATLERVAIALRALLGKRISISDLFSET